MALNPMDVGGFNKIEADLNLLKWMVGFNLALSAGILLKLFG
jgi:hypothetical protein